MPSDINGLQSASSRKPRKKAPEAPSSQPVGLPVLEVGVVHERADAARNRLRVLAAAERLFQARGVTGVTMDDIAAEAQVGKGTLYRRFGDKGGLAVALLDERERELQAGILDGPAPLGQGADPAARLLAFLCEYLTLVAAQLDLMLMSETSTPGSRFRTGAHAFWRQHCRHLFEAAGTADPEVRTDLLLAGLSAEQVRHWLLDEQWDIAELGAALSNTALALIQNGSAPVQPPNTRRRI